MKKFLAILLAVVMLLSLASCGQETAQEQGAAPEKSEQDVAQGENASDELYTEEKTLEDGSTYIAYRKDGPEGPILRAEYTAPDGSYGEEVYTEEGE